jgi:SOS-response transcriptional repressor LexA
MSWADNAIKELQAGNTVQIRPKGNSMKGRIDSGQLVTIAPCRPEEISNGDIVLAKVKGRIYLHLVAGLSFSRNRHLFLIKNNRGRTNGWTGIVYGKVTKVE